MLPPLQKLIHHSSCLFQRAICVRTYSQITNAPHLPKLAHLHLCLLNPAQLCHNSPMLDLVQNSTKFRPEGWGYWQTVEQWACWRMDVLTPFKSYLPEEAASPSDESWCVLLGLDRLGLGRWRWWWKSWEVGGSTESSAAAASWWSVEWDWERKTRADLAATSLLIQPY